MKKILLPISLIVAALILSTIMIWQKVEPAKADYVNEGVLVDTVVLLSQDVGFVVYSQGTVQPGIETTLVSEVSAHVVETAKGFVVGGVFNQGQMLLKLDPTDYEVAVQQSRASLYSRQAQLVQEQAQAEQAAKEWDMSGRSRDKAPILALRTPYLQEAKARVLSAQADLKKAQRKLDQTVIRAPYDGMMKAKRVDVGQFLTAGTQLADIFAVEFAEVRLPLTDQDIAYLDLPTAKDMLEDRVQGLSVELSNIIGGKEYHWSAKIVRTEGVIDVRSRVHYAVARIADPYALKPHKLQSELRPALLIGSFVKAKIQGSRAENVTLVPRSAVRGSNQIMVMDQEQRLRIRQAKVIRADDQYAYIVAGLNPGEELVVSSIQVPVEGMQLRRISKQP